MKTAALPYWELIRESLTETVWPVRCALCDAPGEPLCARCERRLPYIDQNEACPMCGAAFGKLACTECNKLVLGLRGLSDFPLDGCRSVCRASPEALKIIRIYKDSGDRTLAEPLSRLLAQAIPRSWSGAHLTPIPARANALKKRGFDHIEALSIKLARRAHLHRSLLLTHAGKEDQRELDAAARLANMRDAFALQPGSAAAVPPKIILLDDVITTGATIYAAAECLRQAGAKEVYGLSFARV
ncbi:MAG: ComF family protein [Coriobacteriia bacterium]|nr:ComF family protein [Coriobacteriia bacterium]